ncbi:prepilin peptidase [Rhodalgimonas zhirmunskyi]|uniref:Prepilin peptidase n=1 Tax=Rhodalgimonas zhirmunskyi TaxID=2964767 RepID=A0AAJ1UCR9_9RHOB|nr:prepilin peptidase [Rhodoalgimonas zhirmunskyi]MDQ2093782.1 prepilin peptidase [Rhodoalgimonas zhirmunskyi]
MAITSLSALIFALPVWIICIWVAWSDMARMKIPNRAVMALVVVFLVLGLFVMPWDVFLWRLLHLVIILLVGIVMNAAGMIGAGDAKFAAATAPFIALGDLRLVMALFAANLLAAYVTHRIARHTPLRKLAPNWESWHRGWDFPMGLSLGATLAIYIGLGIPYGS